MSARRVARPTPVDEAVKQYLQLKVTRHRVCYVCATEQEARARAALAAKIADYERYPPIVSAFDFLRIEQQKQAHSLYVDAIVIDPDLMDGRVSRDAVQALLDVATQKVDRLMKKRAEVVS